MISILLILRKNFFAQQGGDGQQQDAREDDPTQEHQPHGPQQTQQIANQKMKDALENDDPDYIEQAARNELDYAKPGEKVFVDISGD